MSKDNTRVFAFYKVALKASSAEFKALDPYPPTQYLKWLVEASKKTDCDFIFDNKKKSYSIEKLEESSDYIFLLVRFIDGRSRNVTNQNIKTKVKKSLTKELDEGRRYTSHIYISKKYVNNGFKMIVEENDGFTLGKLSVMLSNIIKSYIVKHSILSVKVPHPTGKKNGNKDVIIKKWPLMEARGTLSDLEGELRTADVTEIHLISYSKKKVNIEGFDQLEEKKTVVRLTVNNPSKTRMGLPILRNLAKQNKSEYDEIAVTYKHQNTKPAIAHMMCDDNLEAMNADRLIKKVKMDSWKSEVAESYDEIQEEVKQAILGMKND